MVFLIKFAMFVTSLFLIVLILLQRGRGGGLAGALGGMGGQSAFGTKAGDVFTKITSGLAIVWILLCVGAVKYMSATENRFDRSAGANATQGEEAIESQPGGESKSNKPASPGRAPSKSEKSSPAPKTSDGAGAENGGK